MDLLNIVLHLDQYLALVISQYHIYFYVIFFLVIFCETGLVITPFLPGDSLLFVAGSLAALDQLNLALLAAIILAAAFLGDNCNFFLGRYLGAQLFHNPKSKIFRRDFLHKTHDFYLAHGRKTVILARFVPIIRSFAPFVAGVGTMPYSRFIIFSFVGSLLWVIIFLGGGYLFGNIPVIKTHLPIIILVVIILSILPIIKVIGDELWKMRRK